MKVTLVRDIEGFANLRNQWRSLLDRSRPNHVFMTWEWLFTWWKYFGQERELFVLVLKDGDEVVGILPLMLFIRNDSNARKTRFLQFIGIRVGARWNDWMDIIALRKKEVIEKFLDYLQRHRHMWDILELRDIPDDSDTIMILLELAKKKGFPVEKNPLSPRPYLPTTSDWELYYASHRPNRIKRDVERKIKRLLARGDLKFESNTSLDLMRDLGALFDFYCRRQEMRDQLAMFSNEKHRNFYRDLVNVFPKEWLDCSVLKFNRKIIAVHFGFRYNHKLYYCTPAFDPVYSAFSPGKVLLKAIIENCFRDDKIAEFDFLRGKDAYKYEWATGERHGYSLQVKNPYSVGWIGRIFCRLPLYSRRAVVKVLSVIAGA
jgi:CelD/BcsL family acetyltransferase involved in cellulose biosynthesis